MNQTLKFLLALAVAAVAVLAFRALVFTMYTVEGSSLEPLFKTGDRVLVNRWSYGLRMGGGRLFRYGRVAQQSIERGDIVAFESPIDSISGVFICRCKAVPGDTINGGLAVPGRVTCADTDYYWLESLSHANPVDSRLFGFVPERCIIGRVFLIMYQHDDSKPLWEGYDWRRAFLLVE
jgi:signal peptidase I